MDNSDYIIIDRAGQFKESDTMIPFNINQNSHIWCPKQLGPVVKSKLASAIFGIHFWRDLLTAGFKKEMQKVVPITRLLSN